ncbi:GNAT family N-acetyltransferase [Arthrobacter citreus]|uniref:GNAT family N-acetyltransferase n=1 Tax=Arthrobacter citreus TaxID=1670 RepID=A0ABZ3A1S1_9MICC
MTLIAPFLPPGTINGVPQPVLTAGIFTLRPWSVADAPVVLAAYQDPAITLWHRRRIDGLDDAQVLVDRWLAKWEKESGASWAVCDDKGLIIGRAALSRINLFEGDGEISYWILPTARGQGVAPEAAAAVRQWAFTGAGLKRLQLTHSTLNEVSCRIAEKTGFALEGVKRSALRHEDGWHDMHLHAAVNFPPPVTHKESDKAGR